jgi:hypothetical protein
LNRRRIQRRLGGPAARRRRHRRVTLVLSLLLVTGLVLVLAPPGDDGTPDPAGADVATICLASNEQIATAQSALLRDNDNPGAIEGFLGDAFVDLARARAAAIRDAEPPPGADVLDVLAEFDAIVDAIEADPASATGLENPFETVNQRWVALGLDGCAIDSSTVQSDG